MTERESRMSSTSPFVCHKAKESYQQSETYNSFELILNHAFAGIGTKAAATFLSMLGSKMPWRERLLVTLYNVPQVQTRPSSQHRVFK